MKNTINVDYLFEMMLLGRRTVFKAFSERDSGGLPPAQLGVMLMLLEFGPMQMSELAAKAHTSRPNLTMLVERLYREGLVTRTQSEKDRRVVEIALTKKACEQFERYKNESAANILKVVEKLSAEDKKQLSDAVQQINEILRKLDKMPS